jgi:prepilin-type N-terminal cleavage/methylation domain-containing protein
VGKRLIPGEPTMKRNTRRPLGFTLVELLVVITIIGMLMALLLPAVNAAVESARQISCKNNMRNLGIALINFESSNQRFPGYTQWIGNNKGPNDSGWSWAVAILPNLDHHDWYDEFINGFSPGPTEGRRSDVFICPSDPPTAAEGADNSFVISAGYASAEQQYEIPANGVAHKYVGNQKVATSVEFISASDGAPYTLLVSENVSAANWHVGWEKFRTGFVWHDLETPTTRKINNKGTFASLLEVQLNMDTGRPSSFHTGGVNATFCDTRTVFLPENIDYVVYQALMTPSGSEAKCADSNAQTTIRAWVLSDDQYQ